MSTRRLLRFSALLAIGVLAAAFAAVAPEAQERRPLLVEGKKTVFQRVLTRPGVPRRDARHGRQTGSYPAFQPLYVFAREGGWLEVGGAAALPPEGWVREADVIPWRHNIVAAFANPAGRERQLLFRNLESLERLLYHESLISIAARWRQAT